MTTSIEAVTALKSQSSIEHRKLNNFYSKMKGGEKMPKVAEGTEEGTVAKREESSVPVELGINALQEKMEALKKEGVTPEDSDYDGFPPEAPAITHILIRQKNQEDDNGEVLVKAGGFKYHGTDEKDEEELSAVMLYATIGRFYYKDQSAISAHTPPTCRSWDGISGSSFGQCLNCEFSKWQENKPSVCKEQRRILIWNLDRKGPFVLVIGPSGIGEWRRLKREVDKSKIPMYYIIFKIGTKFFKDPASHYKPTFLATGILEKDEILQLSKLREQYEETVTALNQRFIATADEVVEEL